MTQELNLGESEQWYRYVDPGSANIELWLPEDEHEQLASEAGHMVEVDYRRRNRGFFVSDGGSAKTYKFGQSNVTTHDESEVPFASQ